MYSKYIFKGEKRSMLSQQTIDIVKSTAPVLADKGNEITTVFYKNMFNTIILWSMILHISHSLMITYTAIINTLIVQKVCFNV